MEFPPNPDASDDRCTGGDRNDRSPRATGARFVACQHTSEQEHQQERMRVHHRPHKPRLEVIEEQEEWVEDEEDGKRFLRHHAQETE